MGIEIKDYSRGFYYPPEFEGLVKLLRFPDSEVKRSGIPNGTIWIFNNCHSYEPRILGNDVGCGMAAFVISEVDPKEGCDKIYESLKDTNFLGRGNHFVDICSAIQSPHLDYTTAHNVLIVHSDGKQLQKEEGPISFEEAERRVRDACRFREELGQSLSDIIGASSCETIGNWPHNLVYRKDGFIFYHKGVIRTEAEKVHILPASLGQKIILYTVHQAKMPPHESMPHATGRIGPTGENKVSLEKVEELRRQLYIPKGISSSALRAEHPDCFNNFDGILSILGEYMVTLAEIKILGYIGKA